MESHFPIVDDVIIFRFLAKLPRVFDWEKWGEIEQLGFDIDIVIRWVCGQTLDRVKVKNIVVVLLLVYNEKREHMTRKSHDMML